MGIIEYRELMRQNSPCKGERSVVGLTTNGIADWCGNIWSLSTRERKVKHMSQTTSEKRNSKRIDIRLLAECYADEICYAGSIENISKSGVSTRIFPTSNAIDITPGTLLKLKFKCLSVEELIVHCEVKWIYMCKTPTHDFMSTMGLEFIHMPSNYNDLLGGLTAETVRY